MTAAVARKVKILIVEDDALIALALAEHVEELGYQVIGPAATIEAASLAIAKEEPDAALLDANVGGASTVHLGAELTARGKKVAFCTGYEAIKDLPASLANAPILTKPILDDDLKAALENLVGKP